MAIGKRTYHHGDLRRAFLVEAARILEQSGPGALTIRELARRVGVSHAASIHHFSDKAMLIAEVAADGFEELAREMQDAEAARNPQARLRDMGRVYVRFALRRPGHFRVMFGQDAASKSQSPRLAVASNLAFVTLEKTVVAALAHKHVRAQDRIEHATFLAWSVVHGAASLALDGALTPGRAPTPDDAELPAIKHALRAVTTMIAS